MPNLPSRRTKTELLEEYNKLLAQHEDLRRTAQLVSDPQSVALISKVEGYTMDQLTHSITDLKSSVNATLNELADKLIAEAQKFSEIQKAIEVAKKNLELNYHVQVAADTLDRLIADHKTQSATFQDEISAKRRDWTREQEERDYTLTVAARRGQEEFEEKRGKQDRLFKEREEALTHQETEMAQLHAQTQNFPNQLERALAQREQDLSKRMRTEFDAQMASAKKDWDAQKNIFEMRIGNLEERIKMQQNEAGALKGELERANKRVQELAIKIIESGSRTAARLEEASTSQSAETKQSS
ncbi:MAG: hypothetical protein UX17_C0061G0007 [Parcubacteria group bacterium GW2011_GWC2_45_7]|nr:MAG: hypothetical protein UX17_C0061G0007 [Parcubacteria group bacterium GW2011_GWC2_45_7]KKU73059.1 MAG: hypothetical protein UX98_C0012G0019 [Parcubacteria group bacterium GW2011_GWA2_47_26]